MFFSEQLAPGRWRAGETWVHDLDARVKLICLIILVWCNFQWESGALIATGAVIWGVKAAGLEYSLVWRWIKQLKWFLIFTFLFHLWSTPGHFIPFLPAGNWGITYEGLHNGSLTALRLVALLAASALLTLSTTPGRLVDGLERLFSPLQRAGLPVADISLMIMLSLHFLPILWIQADRLKKAQLARGIDISRGNIVRRAQNMLPLIIPLVLQAFRRADNLALALEIRHYHSGTKRTSLYCGPLRRADYGVLAAALLVPCLALALERIW